MKNEFNCGMASYRKQHEGVQDIPFQVESPC